VVRDTDFLKPSVGDITVPKSSSSGRRSLLCHPTPHDFDYCCGWGNNRAAVRSGGSGSSMLSGGEWRRQVGSSGLDSVCGGARANGSGASQWLLSGMVSHLVLEGNPSVNHIRARIRNLRTQRLHK
jgi:hypothetical protein